MSDEPKYIEYEDGKRVLLTEDDAPELTDEILSKARPASEMLPPQLFRALTASKRKTPKKIVGRKRITLTLDPEVIEYYRATGAGWESRINDTLKGAINDARQ